MQQKRPAKLNLLSLRRQYTNPHGLYDALREQDSIYFDTSSQSWLVTGHEAVVSILGDPRFISELTSAADASSVNAGMSSINKQMLFMDGEQHRSAQNILLRPLAQIVKRMPADIKRFTQEALAEARKKGEIEAVSEFAAPISLFTIAHVLGMPVDDREELRQLEQWSDTFGDVTSGYVRGDMQDIKKLEDYFRRLIANKRKSPADDLVSSFIAAKDVFPDEDALVINCMMVFAAGRITTKKLLGNGISVLLPQWKRYQSAFAENARFHKLLGEELLRVITPTRYLIREAREDVDLSSLLSSKHLVQRGQRMLLFLEAADYDPTIFSQPEQFNPHRHPNKHIAFGYGPHQCPGATLARVEIQTALEELLSLADLRPKPGAYPAWNTNPNLGGFISNPVVFKPSL